MEAETACPAGPIRMARIGYVLAVLCLVTGGVLAARAYPGGFDWAYSVMSTLASLRYNPQGARWFSLALALAMVLLWPLASVLRGAGALRSGLARFSVAALRLGLLSGMAVGLERAFFVQPTSLVHRSHVALALLCFAGLYLGALTQFALRLRLAASATRWQPGLLLALLVAVGMAQLVLYLAQRGGGWVDRDWRALGVAPWQAFAFWQWVAGAALMLALGYFAARPLPAQP